ncbi:MAG: GAF domain-containing protein, partial [Anaerolineae bacterium]
MNRGESRRLWHRLRVFPTPGALVKSRLRSTTMSWRVVVALIGIALMALMGLAGGPTYLPMLSAAFLAPYLIIPLFPFSSFEHRFYAPRTQGLYAAVVLGVIAVFLLLTQGLSANPLLWLLFFVPAAIAAQVGVLALAGTWLGVGLALWFIERDVRVGMAPAWLVHWLWVGFIAGVLYYLLSRERVSSTTLERLRSDVEEHIRCLAGSGVRDREWPVNVGRLFCDLFQADCAVLWSREEGEEVWTGMRVSQHGMAEAVRCASGQSPPAAAWGNYAPACFVPERRRVSLQGAQETVFVDQPSLGRPELKMELCVPFAAGQEPAAISLEYHRLPVIYPEELDQLARQSHAFAELLAGAQVRQEERAAQARIFGMARHIQEFSAGQAEVFDAILDTFTTKLGYEFAQVWVYDRQGDALVLRAHTPFCKWLKDIRFSIRTDNAYLEALRSQKRCIYKGWQSSFDSQVWGAVKRGTSSAPKGESAIVQALVPLWVKMHGGAEREPVGLLIFGSSASGPGEVPTRDKLDSLVPIYQACASVLRTLQMQEQWQAEVQRVELLNEMTAALLAAGMEPDLDMLSEHIAGYAQRLFGADLVLIYGYTPGTRQFHFLNQAGAFRYMDKPLRNMPPEAPLLQRILDEKQGWFVPDVHDESLLMRARGGLGDHAVSFSVRQGVRSFAGLPMYVGNHPYGVICLNFRRHRTLGPNEQRAMRLFANLAALGFSLHENIEERAHAALSTFREQQSILLHDQFSHTLDELAKRIELMADEAAQAGLLELEDRFERAIRLAQELQTRMARLMRDLVSDRSARTNLMSELHRLRRFFRDLYEFDVELDVDPALPALPNLTQRILV